MIGSPLEPLPTKDCRPDNYLIRVPVYRWLTANQRGSWQVHHRVVRQWRASAAMAARSARVPRIERAYVVVELRFTTSHRRDAANWAPTGKAILDGLVDGGVFPDDNTAHVIGPDLRIGPRATRPAVFAHIFPQGEER